MSETSDVGFRPVRTKKAEGTALEAAGAARAGSRSSELPRRRLRWPWQSSPGMGGLCRIRRLSRAFSALAIDSPKPRASPWAVLSRPFGPDVWPEGSRQDSSGRRTPEATAGLGLLLSRLSCPGPLGRMRSAISRFAAGNDDLDAPRRRHTPEMNLTDVESAALGLPLDQRRALALRLWESVELEPGDESVMVKPNLPIVVAARSGWILSGRFPP